MRALPRASLSPAAKGVCVTLSNAKKDFFESQQRKRELQHALVRAQNEE